jgi:hypothetical protein
MIMFYIYRIMIATQMWLLLPPLKAILYKVSVEIILIFLLPISQLFILVSKKRAKIRLNLS